tara:strand:+ start:11782 stop:12024 length:243 start_codon:yes stop_codon:yes gene_type:complete
MSVTKSITEPIRQLAGGSVFMHREIVNHFRGHESVTSRVFERLAVALGKATIEFDYNLAFESTVGLLTALLGYEKRRVAE